MRNGRRGAAGRIWGVMAANALLAAIITGLFVFLGRGGGDVRAVAASGAVYRGREGVALVCRMSWSAASLDKILRALDERGARMTFAVSAEWVGENPIQLLSMVRAGHEIAALAVGEGSIEPAVRSIEAITGRTPRICIIDREGRARSEAAQLGLTAVIGSMDLVTTRGDARDILRRAAGNAKGGDVILADPTAAFSDALGNILDYFSSSGLTGTTVSGTIYD